jgi:hypothetical protein
VPRLALRPRADTAADRRRRLRMVRRLDCTCRWHPRRVVVGGRASPCTPATWAVAVARLAPGLGAAPDPPGRRARRLARARDAPRRRAPQPSRRRRPGDHRAESATRIATSRRQAAPAAPHSTPDRAARGARSPGGAETGAVRPPSPRSSVRRRAGAGERGNRDRSHFGGAPDRPA